jgi:hypothetical protein
MRGFVGEGRAIDIKRTIEISTISGVTNGELMQRDPKETYTWSQYHRR